MALSASSFAICLGSAFPQTLSRSKGVTYGFSNYVGFHTLPNIPVGTNQLRLLNLLPIPASEEDWVSGAAGGSGVVTFRRVVAREIP